MAIGGWIFWQPVQVNSQPKSSGLVWGSAAAWCHSTFIKWTGWTLAMALPWWQHHKHCLGIIIIIIINTTHAWGRQYSQSSLAEHHISWHEWNATTGKCLLFAVAADKFWMLWTVVNRRAEKIHSCNLHKQSIHSSDLPVNNDLSK